MCACRVSQRGVGCFYSVDVMDDSHSRRWIQMFCQDLMEVARRGCH